MGLSQRPHGQDGLTPSHSRGQRPTALLGPTQTEDIDHHQPQRLNTIVQGPNMVRSRSSQRIPATASPTTPTNEHRGQDARRHSHNPALRNPRENEALAEALQPSDHLRSPAISFHVSSPTCEELSRSLAYEITRISAKGHMTPDKLQDIIATHLREHLPSSGTSNKRTAEEAGLLDDNMPRNKKVTCKKCSKTMPRLCDLKKHEKRHSRPWGCTNEGCNKSFGSKNDWKRHENSQHYQLETWRCHEESSTSRIKQCAKIFFRRDPFQAHLKKDHRITDENRIRDECRSRRIGRNWQSGFWCGFCKSIIKLQKKGLEAWDERFNHIDNEHFKHGERIDDWYPLDKDVPKGELRAERNKGRNKHGVVDVDSDPEESDLDLRPGSEDSGPPPEPPPPPPPPTYTEPTHLRRNDAQRAAQRSERHRTRQWYCVSIP